MAGSQLYPENTLIMAPLAGFTDLAYRRAAYRAGCRYAFTEMVDAASLSYANGGGEALLQRGDDEPFLAVQLVGAEPELLKKACGKLNLRNFDLLDFNLGCPVPKVVRKGAGAALGQQISLAHSCFAVLAKESRFPVTAKMRILDSVDPAPTLDLCAGLVDLGAKALTIHGRTRENFYTGSVSFDVIRAVKEKFPLIPVIANGGVKSLDTYHEMREKSRCSRVMLAQGIMGNPWLFRELEADSPQPPTLEEYLDMIKLHIRDMVDIYGEASAMRQSRKIVHDYLKGRGFPAVLRSEASMLTVFDDLLKLLDKAEKSPRVATAPKALKN